MGEFVVGDVGLDGTATIVAIERKDRSVPVYNIELHGEHVYQVTTSSFLVHNAGPISCITDNAPNTNKTSAQLRAEWEAANKKPWPKDPVTGGNQDVSHIVPKADGGVNTLENIEPMIHNDHMQMHMDNGDFKRWGARRGKTP